MSDTSQDNLYDILAEAYEEIFPTDQKRIDFCRTLIDRYGARSAHLDLFDIGCGTGELCRRLATEGFRCLGLDLDARMIEQASVKAGQALPNRSEDMVCEFHEADMLNAASVADGRSAAVITCFGNSLVHLNSEEEIRSFLDETSIAAADDGCVVIQILNYDAIMQDRPSSLPPLESDHYLFHRAYEYDSPDRYAGIAFQGTVTDKATGERWTGQTQIRPVFRDELESTLKEIFRHVACTEDYAGTPARQDSPVLLFVARNNRL